MEISPQKYLEPVHQTAAALLASAVLELFPGALLAGGQGTQERFFYDFVFPFAFEKEFLSLVEERMRFMIRERREVRLLEMMPSNAAAMMRHHGQTLLAETMEDVRRATVPLCQIGDFAVWSPSPFQENLAIPFFKLLEAFPLPLSGGRTVRIIGAAAETKEALKQIARQKQVSSRSHVELALENGMFAPLDNEGHWIWGPRGEDLRQRMMQWWKELHVRQNFKCIATPAALIEGGGKGNLTALHRDWFFRFGTPRVAEIALVATLSQSDPWCGLLSPKACFVDRAHLFFSEEKLGEECISSLRFILEIPKILGFEYDIVLSVSSEGSRARTRVISLFRKALECAGVDYAVGKDGETGMQVSIDIRIADAMGRRWTGPYLGIPVDPMPAGKGCMLVRSMFGSLERTVALLLERRGGWLPLIFAQEQVRILVVNAQSESYARQMCVALQASGFRVHVDWSKETLKVRLYRAVSEKVPYVVLAGEREERAKVLTVRAYGETEEQTVSMDEFCMRLNDEMGSITSELTN